MRTTKQALLDAMERRKGLAPDLVTEFACWVAGPDRVAIAAVKIGDKRREWTFRELLAGDL